MGVPLGPVKKNQFSSNQLANYQCCVGMGLIKKTLLWQQIVSIRSSKTVVRHVVVVFATSFI